MNLAARAVCPRLTVTNADANVNANGVYVETTLRVVWAPTKPVYRNTDMDMFLFFLIYEGWSIGTLDMVNSAVYFHGGKVVKKGNECACMHACIL